MTREAFLLLVAILFVALAGIAAMRRPGTFKIPNLFAGALLLLAAIGVALYLLPQRTGETFLVLVAILYVALAGIAAIRPGTFKIPNLFAGALLLLATLGVALVLNPPRCVVEGSMAYEQIGHGHCADNRLRHHRSSPRELLR